MIPVNAWILEYYTFDPENTTILEFDKESALNDIIFQLHPDQVVRIQPLYTNVIEYDNITGVEEIKEFFNSRIKKIRTEKITKEIAKNQKELEQLKEQLENL